MTKNTSVNLKDSALLHCDYVAANITNPIPKACVLSSEHHIRHEHEKTGLSSSVPAMSSPHHTDCLKIA